VTTGREPKIKR